ncbi:MAG TPA: ATP-binding protein [Desulfobulbaceae bacterium]|nr:ATP-binding protein [Desulfobulbaceae bacterium]
MKKRTMLSWSSGKDSAWTLQVLRQDPEIELAGLFTVINEKYKRASMHATRLELLRLQAEAAGLPLITIPLPDQSSLEECDRMMGRFVAECVKNGIACMAFGDLFLEDIRQYRENQLRGSGIQPLFPLWRLPTWKLALRMLDAGVEAYISCVDLARLPSNFAGRRWSRSLLDELPAECDPCGENGEIHTIITAGPMLNRRIPVRVGEIVERNGFAYADLIPL